MIEITKETIKRSRKKLMKLQDKLTFKPNDMELLSQIQELEEAIEVFDRQREEQRQTKITASVERAHAKLKTAYDQKTKAPD